MRIEAVGRACFPIVQINRKRTPLISRPSGNNPLGTANHGRMYNSKLESLSMEFFRQEYWSGSPFHSLGPAYLCSEFLEFVCSNPSEWKIGV